MVVNQIIIVHEPIAERRVHHKLREKTIFNSKSVQWKHQKGLRFHHRVVKLHIEYFFMTFQWLKKYVTVVCLPGNRELNIRLGINSKKENPRSCSLIPDGWIIPTLIYICSIPSLRCMIFCSTLGGMALLLDLGHTYNSSCRVNFA